MIVDEDLKEKVLDFSDNLYKEVRCLLGLVRTGLKIADKKENYIFFIRLDNCKDLLLAAKFKIEAARGVVLADANAEDASEAVKEFLAMAVDYVNLAKFNYAYYLEIRINPNRDTKEIVEAATKRKESLYI